MTGTVCLYIFQGSEHKDKDATRIFYDYSIVLWYLILVQIQVTVMNINVNSQAADGTVRQRVE